MVLDRLNKKFTALNKRKINRKNFLKNGFDNRYLVESYLFNVLGYCYFNNKVKELVETKSLTDILNSKVKTFDLSVEFTHLEGIYLALNDKNTTKFKDFYNALKLEDDLSEALRVSPDAPFESAVLLKSYQDTLDTYSNGQFEEDELVVHSLVSKFFISNEAVSDSFSKVVYGNQEDSDEFKRILCFIALNEKEEFEDVMSFIESNLSYNDDDVFKLHSRVVFSSFINKDDFWDAIENHFVSFDTTDNESYISDDSLVDFDMNEAYDLPSEDLEDLGEMLNIDDLNIDNDYNLYD